MQSQKTVNSKESSSIQSQSSKKGLSLPAVPVLQQKDSSLESGIVQQKANDTGMPDALKSGIENLSGMDMSDVKVHYNSSQPAQLHALAYAQGNDIHIGPGQEQHLAHEAWHVVHQRQERVKPTLQMKQGETVNDDPGLEQEADVMGAKALSIGDNSTQLSKKSLLQKRDSQNGLRRTKAFEAPVQRMLLLSGEPVKDLKDEKFKDFTEPQLQRVKEMIISRGRYGFADHAKLQGWVDQSLRATEFAQILHHKLHHIIAEDIKSKGGTIADRNFSTTGVLFKEDGVLEVACNFAVTPAGKSKAEGRDVTLDEVLLALNSFPGGSPLELGKSSLLVHNSGAVINMAGTIPENENLSKIQMQMVQKNWADALTAIIGASWPSFAVHADVVLVARARAQGLRNPMIGISKAPCELCHGEEVVGRREDEGTGLMGKIGINLPKNKFPSKAIDEIKNIIAVMFNDGMGGYEHERFDVAFKETSQSIIITVPRWIPPEFLTYKTEEADIITIEIEAE